MVDRDWSPPKKCMLDHIQDMSPKKNLQCTDLAKPLNWFSFLVALRRTCFGFHRGPAKLPGYAPWHRIPFLLQGLQLFPQGRCLVTGLEGMWCGAVETGLAIGERGWWRWRDLYSTIYRCISYWERKISIAMLVSQRFNILTARCSREYVKIIGF